MLGMLIRLSMNANEAMLTSNTDANASYSDADSDAT